MFIVPIPLPLIFGREQQQTAPSTHTNNPSPTSIQPTATPTEQEWRCFCILNQYRQQYGRPSLAFSPHLLTLARHHSKRQHDQGVMHHDHSHPYGENVAKAMGVYDPVMTAIHCWLNSPPHFQNIVSPHARYSAIGIYVGNDNAHRPINEHDHWLTGLFQI